VVFDFGAGLGVVGEREEAGSVTIVVVWRGIVPLPLLLDSGFELEEA